MAVKRMVVLAVVLVGAAALALWDGRSGDSAPPGAASPALDEGWSGLDAQARCDSAGALVSHSERWPILCRWRDPGEVLRGQSFPPPTGPPPYDNPHVEVYLAPSDTREEVARVIAHELGHMHHTREAAFVSEWLAARGLAADTPPGIWTEDYAEVFAALFGPPSQDWRAPTPRPSAEALESLRRSFFS